MGIKLNLNTQPYYDDFAENKEFYKVLFRPGFSIQARELTTLQTILQNQIEKFGSHMFEEGAMVIPGNIALDIFYHAVKLEDTYANNTVEDYITDYVGTVITGSVSGVKAKVVNYSPKTSTDPLTLYVKYEASGTNNTDKVFKDNENISASGVVAGYPLNTITATVNSVETGSSASIGTGVYFTRGHFVKCQDETILLDKYNDKPSYRIGFDITESLVNPEGDVSLLDNASGVSNFAAKGAHRLAINLKLIKKDLTSVDDADFIELLRVDKGRILSKVLHTEYAIIEETFARRTYDESGDYTVENFDIEPREHLNTGINRGIYTTDESGDSSKLVLGLSSGKAYVRGYEIETLATQFIDVDKARKFDTQNNTVTPASLGNFINVTNVYGTPDITLTSSSEPFKMVQLYDTETTTRGYSSGDEIGFARVRAMEHSSGVGNTGQYKLYLFDIQMKTQVMPRSVLLGGSTTFTHGARITGSKSGAYGYVTLPAGTGSAALGTFDLIQVSGKFINDIQGTTTTTSLNIGSTYQVNTVNSISAGSFVSGTEYTITVIGTTDFTLIGSANNTVGTVFTATGVGAGNGAATDANFTSFGSPDNITGTTFTATSTGDLSPGNLVVHYTFGDTLISSVSGATPDTQTSSVENTIIHDLSSVKQIFSDAPSAGEDFTSDIVLESPFILTGTLTVAGAAVNAGTIQGNNTKFSSELRVGDQIMVPKSTGSGGYDTVNISSILGDDSITVTPNTSTVTGGTGGTFSATRNRSKLNEQEELVSIYKLPKSNIKTLLTESNLGLSDTSLTFKRQYIATTVAGAVSFSAGTNEIFSPFNEHDYVLSILKTGGGSAVQGDVIDLTGKVVYSGGTITITDVLGFGAGACQVKLIASIEKTIGSRKLKSSIPSVEKFISNTTSTSDIFGTRISDLQISLGVADVYNINAVYLSKNDTTTAISPSITFSSVDSATFNVGENIVGETTGAIGTIIGYAANTKTVKYWVVSGEFDPTENVKYNITSTTFHTAVIDNTNNTAPYVNGISSGDTNIINSFTFDDGQRDSFYDISSLYRKPSSVVPQGQLLIIYDYFSHSNTGDYFSVDSYTNEVEYSNIPVYSATRVDPDTLAPAGEYDLRDSLDFRSRVSDSDGLTNPFMITERDYSTTGSSRYDIPKVDSLIRVDFENYLNRTDHLYLNKDGEFVIQKGVDAEIPSDPDVLESAMKLAEIFIPAYTHSASDVNILKSDNSRYTMRDIGKLDKRIGNLEYYTSLNMLEQDTQSLQIMDSNGLDRFKSGFLVDNFSGHSVGDVLHVDYNCSIDFEEGVLRPDSYHDNIELQEYNTSDTQRSVSSYMKTGDLILLPYTDTLMISQAFASRVENVNPFAIQTWIGVLKMSPDSDTWIDTKKAPDIIRNVEGNYNSILARERNRLGTIWGSWKTYWTQNRSTSGGVRKVRTRRFGRGLDLVRRTTTWTDAKQRRSGVNTRIIAVRERKLAGTRVIDSSIIPFMRSKLIDVNVTGMKPNTRIYPFFDNIAVSNHFKTSTNTSGPFLTDGSGSFTGSFKIPNQKGLRFRVGKKILRLTDRSDNNMTAGLADTSAEATFESAGTLNTMQSTFLSLRNAKVVRRSVSDKRRIKTGIRTSDRVVGWWDPLAQTFLVDKQGGAFVTKVDLFFQSKDTTLPVTMMIRSVENGMPAKDILPFSTVALNPDQVNISDNGLMATTFTFDSPVYLNDREEYCIVVQTSSTDYKCWISQVGEKDVNSTRSISEQPYMGVLFKSQNSSTWTASQMEDLKFNLYNAKFDTSVIGNVKLKNKELTVDSGHIDTLTLNPLSTEDGVNKVRIFQENHGHHSTVSSVIVDGVVSPSGEEQTSTGLPDALAGIPLTEINTTHTSISDIEIDSYCITTTATAVGSISAGGKSVLVTRNIPFDAIHPILAVLDFPETTINSNIQATTSTSLGGSETSYIKNIESSASSIILNDDTFMNSTSLITSNINSINQLNGRESFNINVNLSTDNENISPIIDTGRMSVITIANRVDNISSPDDIGTASTYVPSTSPEGDNNPAVYMTKKVSLEVPATALRTMLAGAIQDDANIEVYYKILRSDSADIFDDIGWVGFNTNGESDRVVSTSKDETDFKDYLYTVSDLPDFIAFSIKIVMKSKDSTIPPLIKDFRTIALEL